MREDNSNLPVLVACGQVTERDKSGAGCPPTELMRQASEAAINDAGCQALLADISQIATTSLTVDAEQVKTPLSRAYKNLPKTLARQLGISVQDYFYAATGGNTPQYLVNHFSQKIASGEAQTVLLAGAESLATMLSKFDRWYKWLLPKSDWKDDPGGRPRVLGDNRAPCNPYERHYGLEWPATVYPMFENALQHHYGRARDRHHQRIGEMFSALSRTAATNSNAWFQHAWRVDDLIVASPDNRMIAYPYTKRLNSMIAVNMAAALVLTSAANAQKLGIAEDRWVYLRGFADTQEIWHLTERHDYHSSPALRQGALTARQMAGVGIDEIHHFDLYSCFPSALQIACDEIGIRHDDERGLTVTGGLPYFGGPGNNYAMHAIAEMMQRLRAHPDDVGLVNANGWFLTKHSIGLYSTRPSESKWQPIDVSKEQVRRLNVPRPQVIECASGDAEIETFTVLFDRNGQAERGIIIGRDVYRRRFIADTPTDVDLLDELCKDDSIGRRGRVNHRRGRNTFAW